MVDPEKVYSPLIMDRSEPLANRENHLSVTDNVRRSLDVNVTNPATEPVPVYFSIDPTREIKNIYNESPAVIAGADQLLCTYTVPVGKLGALQRVTFAGENVAKYTLKIAGTESEKYYTYFSGPLGGEFNFTAPDGYPNFLAAGTVIQLRVTHSRPDVADFNGRLQILEIISP